MTEEEAQQSEETPVSETATEAMEAAPETPSEVPATEAEAPATEEVSGEADAPASSGVVEVDAVIDGVVQRITPYGAFIQLPGGKLGLIHISEIDRNYVKDVHDHLREGDTIQAKILAIKEDGKIDLSIKALQDPQPRMERRRGNDPGFEQMLRKFLRSSEERQVDVKRSVMHKRK
jgi:S1 RNA binding domain protein